MFKQVSNLNKAVTSVQSSVNHVIHLSLYMTNLLDILICNFIIFSMMSLKSFKYNTGGGHPTVQTLKRQLLTTKGPNNIIFN
jgi:hypothetical protein